MSGYNRKGRGRPRGRGNGPQTERSKSPSKRQRANVNQYQRVNKNDNRASRDSSESRQSNAEQKRAPRYSKFNQLLRLSKMNGNEIAAEVYANTDFKLLLNSNLNNDFLVLTIRVLAELRFSNFTRIVRNILTDACKSRFFEKLKYHLEILPLESQVNMRENKFYWEDVDGFWEALAMFFKTIINIVPVEAHHKLIPLILQHIIQSIMTQATHDIDLHIKTQFKQLSDQLYEKKKKNVIYEASSRATMLDFRQLSVVPTVEDLNDHHPYIRPCRIQGAYDSVEHYLDVQFRLLREDFIFPLRNGILEYKRLADTRIRSTQISDIRVFQEVEIISPTIVKDKVGFIISIGKKQKINWIRSKCFMYGSLLCLTNDNFNSVLFATVAERDPKLLEKGEVIIEPCIGTQITDGMYNCKFVMVESKVYFLPYYYTLNSLRDMSEENFPMKRYIIDAKSTATPPKYLNHSTVYAYKEFKITVLDNKSWPSPVKLGLDISQYEALKGALQQELSVLHGPPGTGKTFMALQIASTLITNSSAWYNPAQPTPMIVVCLTNHALDQFLEGILEYTDSLLRIGEQSKNPKLAKYKLKTVRDNYLKDEKNKHHAWQRTGYYRRELKRILDQLGEAYSAFKALTSCTSLVSPNLFRTYLSNQELQNLTARNLLTKLFGTYLADIAVQINPTQCESVQSPLIDDSDSENEYIDADDDLEVASVSHADDSSFTCLEISHIDIAKRDCETELSKHKADSHQFKQLSSQLSQLQFLQTALTARLSEHPQNMHKSEAGPLLRDINWETYWYWLESCHLSVKEKIKLLEKEYQEISSQLSDFKSITDLEVMRNSLVIGLTTTGAARLHESLRALQSPIVLVEEAAEILEAHVICSLTEHCQQVILIGDHKQLRPKPATYELEKYYNLDISLFERIVKMRDKCTQLVIQHRMRPEISALLTPSIYEKLSNHISVYSHPMVKGMNKSLFFLNHSNEESRSSDIESVSNPFEVKFLLALAKHLRFQGYAPKEITILSTYNGQLFKFKEAAKNIPILREVRLTTVDNYQGEENKIILLSLVRNNKSGNVGFLRIENRVCVALSRAREGFYIMGNMNNLIVGNEIWPKIKRTLESSNALGDHLVLQCQLHSDQLTEVKSASDFKHSIDGGCTRQCDALLSCGHTCNKRCHLSNREHKKYICKQPCLQACIRGHVCGLLCNETCKPCQNIITFTLSCSHTCQLPCSTDITKYECNVEITTMLQCGHVVTKPCHRPASTYPCPMPCKYALQCGHVCRKKCHVKDDPCHLKYICQENCKKIAIGCESNHLCPKKCHELCERCAIVVKKDRSCGHTRRIECSTDVESKICAKKCNRNLPCGHPCKRTCSEPCGQCKIMVDKIIPDCGHVQEIECGKKPLAKLCKSKCHRMLKCGHPCKALCSEPCTKKCEYPRPMLKPGLCQHSYALPCYKIEAGLAEYADALLQHCPTPCAAQLPCGHVCGGTCGTCKQGRIHEPCREKCNKILLCGHKCQDLCKDMCSQCGEVCSLRCEHDVCRNACRAPCKPCQKPCTLKCQHIQCKKMCSEICDQDHCDKPCAEQLKCGHQCVGFCGEPCPPLCRICDTMELSKFIRESHKNDVRFVYLPDCGHSIESNFLDWVWLKSNRIGIKTCPQCETRIIHCKRYANQIKRERINRQFVSTNVYQKRLKLIIDKQRIINDITRLLSTYTSQFPDIKARRNLVESLQFFVDHAQFLNILQLKDMSIKLTIAETILSELQKVPSAYRNVNDCPVIFNQVIMLMTSLSPDTHLSNQMVDDLRNELNRLYYMVQLSKLERTKGLAQSGPALQMEIIRLGLLNLRKFTEYTGNVIFKQLSDLRQSLKSRVKLNEVKGINVLSVVGIEEEGWYKCPNGHIFSIECKICPSAPLAPVVK
ncbi:NFX1-type zinc finger-containing protein 1-like [Athalia rosae]|uniref:NFX1-type zinc finger-containing protein 1-like n=1 Tax=Athalia rosae TaxID=37344 RepID=UPI00203491DE|nr:NFX1-type zinc finger-containing protein 1-like [Athalia rosae]XP_020711645.2 NFX1-type zinc finger-containing protein 1-like [Athalia rosae]XP_048505866.1 NFX1-type zinc finger-containing protein 1-like [Athalia rosae]XP_048505867.1 NFX1-type zinc finger-containing protein 1-like [Athalia rosae]XP_048505868.1 NFX1-type zinc finger-containing protein 1-like [Athalia rosae]XP_048505869.1 NFX1-type zinc finger-containing protein 1-like [Athalia rosae]XP_048505870.1 NFX1-type zinc finger-cont